MSGIIVKKTWREKVGLAEMLKGGVIMDVINPEQAKIAEDAGAVAVMALERVPADIRRDGGVARMSDPEMIQEIQAIASIPVMAKCRIGHFAEAQILEALEVDFIDESEVLTPADEENHVDKHNFTVPFVCGAKNLGEALRRCAEGAALIRTKGEAGTGDVVEAVRHMRTIQSQIRQVQNAREDELYVLAKNHQACISLIREVHETGKLPVPNFSAGGIATPADAALMMQLGAETVFVGSGIFKSAANLSDSERLKSQARRARAIVEAVLFYNEPKKVAEISKGLGEPMVGINCDSLTDSQKMSDRGW
jgi:pyridoxal 5'-phosphate synthase pdxS subunit